MPQDVAVAARVDERAPGGRIDWLGLLQFRRNRRAELVN